MHVSTLDDFGKRIAKAAFPSYSGRKFQLCPTDGPVSVTSYWDGGSRDYYAMVRLADLAVLPVPQNGTPFDGGPFPPVEIPSGCVIVEHSIFCGKDMGLRFYVRADEAVGLIPPPADLTDDEAVVLEYTAALKNTYAGRTGVRFSEASRETGITQDRWNDASDTLRSRKLLNKAGAITPEGRNARDAGKAQVRATQKAHRGW